MIRRSAAILDYLLNPISVLELRTTLRSTRFFMVFTIAQVLATIIMVIALATIGSERNATSDEIGRGLFTVFFFMESGIATLFFPAFTCTAIIGEREKKNLDLLISTDLSAGEIVWGKFLSAFGYIFLLLIASLPMAMVSFLFGGVPPLLIGLSYLLLLTISALYLMIALFASSYFKTTVRSIIGSYCGVAIVAFPFHMIMAVLAEHYLYRHSLVHLFSMGIGVPHLLVGGFILAAACAAIVLPYLLAVNQLKPSSANCSTNIRVFCLVVISVLFALGWFGYFYAVDQLLAQGRLREVPYIFSTFAGCILAMVFVVIALGLAWQRPVPSLAVQRQIDQKHCRWLLWLFYPGALSGAIYISLLALVVFMLLYLGVYWSTQGFSNKIFRWDKHFRHECFFFGPLLLWSFTVFWAMLCAYLSLRLKKKMLRQSIALSVLLLLVVLLPLYVPLSMMIDNHFRATIWNGCYFSPVLCYLSSLLVKDQQVDLYLWQTVPIYCPGLVIYFLGAFWLLLVNIRLNCRAIKQLEKQNSDWQNLIGERNPADRTSDSSTKLDMKTL